MVAKEARCEAKKMPHYLLLWGKNKELGWAQEPLFVLRV
jgi:hypothetical protein